MDQLLPVRSDRTGVDRAGPRRARVAVAVAVVLGLALLAGGCSTVQAFADLDGALTDAGFGSTAVNVAAGDPVVLTVKADAPPGDSIEEGQATASEVVWETFPRRFESTRITIDGESRTLTYDQLQERLGDRPAGLDEQGDLADDVNRVGIGFLLGLLAVGVLFVAVAGVVALVIVRSRRRSPPSARLGGPPVPWAPPPQVDPASMVGAPPTGPIPPPEGWSPPATPPPPPAAGPITPAATSVPSPAPTPRPADPPSHREARAEARRLGRRVRGPRPPASQLPPGWG